MNLQEYLDPYTFKQLTEVLESYRFKATNEATLSSINKSVKLIVPSSYGLIFNTILDPTAQRPIIQANVPEDMPTITITNLSYKPKYDLQQDRENVSTVLRLIASLDLVINNKRYDISDLELSYELTDFSEKSDINCLRYRGIQDYIVNSQTKRLYSKFMRQYCTIIQSYVLREYLKEKTWRVIYQDAHTAILRFMESRLEALQRDVENQAVALEYQRKITGQ